MNFINTESVKSDNIDNQNFNVKNLKRNKIFAAIISSVFVFIFLWCPIIYLLHITGVIKVIDTGNYKDPEKVYESGVLAPVLNSIEKGKSELNNIYTNYLPAYSEIVNFLRSKESSFNLAFVKALNVKTPVPAADSSPAIEEGSTEVPPVERYAVKLSHDEGLHKYIALYPEQLIDTSSYLSEDEMAARLEVQLVHMNRIIASNTDVNFFFYIGTRMQDTLYFPDLFPGEKSTNKFFTEFLDRLEGAEGIGKLDIFTLEKRLEYIFRTDHHWNAKGSYSGYHDIITMMQQVDGDLGDIIPLKGLIEYPNVKMRGSAANISQFEEFYESFAVVDIDLPTTDTYARMRSQKRVYQLDDHDRHTYFDHYDAYYTKPDKYIYPEVTNGRNLLIIGDSFTWWASFMIASHFETTYMYYPWHRENLDYNQFIKDNKITDVLFMQFSDRILFNTYNDCPLENIITN